MMIPYGEFLIFWVVQSSLNRNKMYKREDVRPFKNKEIRLIYKTEKTVLAKEGESEHIPFSMVGKLTHINSKAVFFVPSHTEDLEGMSLSYDQIIDILKPNDNDDINGI